MALDLVEDLLDAKARVLRHRQVANPVAVDELLSSLDQRLEEVDGMVLVRGKVGLAVDGQEVEPTERVSLARDTYTSRLERYLLANI